MFRYCRIRQLSEIANTVNITYTDIVNCRVRITNVMGWQKAKRLKATHRQGAPQSAAARRIISPINIEVPKQHQIREINLEHLYESNMISNVKEVTDLNSKENEFSFLDELVRGVLLAGMDQVLKHRNFEFRKGRLTKSGSSLVTEDDAKAQLTTECVNHKRKFWPSPYLTYFQKTHNEERRTTLIRESSMISPVTVLLFSQGKVIGRKYCVEQNDDKILLQISGKQNVQMVCDPKTAGAILRFRDVMWSIVQFYVENDVQEGILKDRDNFSQVVFHTYKQKMLKTLGNLLNSASAKIDSVDKTILLKNVGKIKD
ncbi:putative ATP-dependent RNA helicase DHX30 [Copidosoma floridanum]|uniref:putative ATP-dependent RNA helicase DHX30 n=1 Tax=Copidosoma floridanum TaxID=29053 RepID=UPI000C6F5533|nr:putative ATP-dependent RNA helicase DHX30 [Copidosoma floridanum]